MRILTGCAAGLSRLLLGMVLSISPTQAGEIRIAHCLAGCPRGASVENDLVVRPVYALSFNHSTALADWVVYRVTSGSIGIATSLSRQPVDDPFIADTLKPEDYAEAGELGLVASHWVPLVSFARTPFWRDLNYHTNLAPRSSELNRGAWYGLEWAVRNLASRNGEAYVLTGPLFDSEGSGAAELRLATAKPHRVPSGFFKIVANSQGEMSVFLFDQTVEFHVHHCEHRTGLATVERLSGFDFFPEAPRWPTGTLDTDLGCPRTGGVGVEIPPGAG